MNQPQHDHLHRLIRSMDPAEKRYFKVYTSRHLVGGSSNHQILFDAIDAQDEYDEAALLRRFKKEAFTNRFAITKHRLYDTVLRSLDAYHAESSVDARLRRSLHHVEILHARALYPEAEKLLASIRRTATKHGRISLLMAVREWESRLMEQANYAHANTPAVEAWTNEGHELRDMQAQVDRLWAIKSDLFRTLYAKGQARSTAAHSALAEVKALPDLQPASLQRSPRAEYLYHHVRSAVAFAEGNAEQSREHLLRNRSIIRGMYEHFSEEPSLLLGVLGNLAFVTAQLGHHGEAHDLLREFRQAPVDFHMPDTPDLDVKLFSTSYSLELALLCNAGDFVQAAALLPTIERGLLRREGSIGAVRKAGFYYQMAYAAFGAGDAETALRLTNKLLNDISIDESEDAVCYGRLLHLILLLETGRTDMVRFAARNTTRFLQTRGRTFRTEQLLIGLVQGIAKNSTAGHVQEKLSQFHDKVSALQDQPAERALYGHLDPIAWAISRLHGKPFGEVVKERLLGRGKAA